MLTPNACCRVYYSLDPSTELQVDYLLYRYAGGKEFQALVEIKQKSKCNQRNNGHFKYSNTRKSSHQYKNTLYPKLFCTV